jgi:hypothetical protein
MKSMLELGKRLTKPNLSGKFQLDFVHAASNSTLPPPECNSTILFAGQELGILGASICLILDRLLESVAFILDISLGCTDSLAQRAEY